MKIILAVAAFFFISASGIAAINGNPEYGFFVGEYNVIGKKSNGELYSGTVSIVESPDGLRITRIINDITTKSVAKFDYITDDKIQVITTSFTDGNDKPDATTYYTATYEIHSTAGNYPLLTGFIYPSTASDMEPPAMETLFYKE